MRRSVLLTKKFSTILLVVIALLARGALGQHMGDLLRANGGGLSQLFDMEVTRGVTMSELDQLRYAQMLARTLDAKGLSELASQYFVLVDRDPKVQTVMLYWNSPEGIFHFIGASPCSTGRPGEFEHFETPLGVFEHSLANLDFRAEGTRNVLGIRGYGTKGMRVYDFGWVIAPRGWGPPGSSPMRLQMHSTDPDILEPRLGIAHSKGCIRIPASLNDFIDRHAILDAAYEEGLQLGQRFWVLRTDRTPTPWSGRYLVVVDSRTAKEP